MSAVGLTKARQRALETWKRGGCVQLRMLTSLMDDGLAQYVAGEPLTPRGHAALAAPRMTVSQFRILAYLESGSWPDDRSVSSSSAWRSCADKGWIEYESDFDWGLTPSGLKALNDVRAATGSELYKDNMP